MSYVGSAATVAGDMLVLYGSQTGTAEELAEELAACASERGLAVRLVSMEDYDVRAQAAPALACGAASASVGPRRHRSHLHSRGFASTTAVPAAVASAAAHADADAAAAHADTSQLSSGAASALDARRRVR